MSFSLTPQSRNRFGAATAAAQLLRDLARRRGKDAQTAFIQQLFELKQQHSQKRTLIQRIDKAFTKSP